MKCSGTKDYLVEEKDRGVLCSSQMSKLAIYSSASLSVLPSTGSLWARASLALVRFCSRSLDTPHPIPDQPPQPEKPVSHCGTTWSLSSLVGRVWR